MAENSQISWCDHTFNPWVGCTRVSPACDGCYAAELMGTEGTRFKRVVWGGPGLGEGTRDRTKDWSKPHKWNRQAANAPGQIFVFCASLADVFDNAVPSEWRADLFSLISATPNLTWLLLTKRPQNIVKLGMASDPDPKWRWPPNAAIGTTIEDRARLTLNAPALGRAATMVRPAFTFWSCEPLLEDLGNVSAILPDWVITGGETDQGAHKARAADPAWYRSLRDQCAAAHVPFHFKQWGEWVSIEEFGAAPAPGDILYHGPTPLHGIRAAVRKIGKRTDPCTLDGMKHLARYGFR